MKNKVILNILFVYFFALILVLIFQIKTQNIVATEPISTEISVEDKVKNSVILFVESPLFIFNENMHIIDENDFRVVPKIIDDELYLPDEVLIDAFNADIKQTKQDLTIRINNKAVIISFYDNSVKIIDNISEEVKLITLNPKIIDNNLYIPITFLSKVLEKELYYNNGLIIISNMQNILDPIYDASTIQNISEEFKTLPNVGSAFNLKNLLRKHFNTLNKQNLLEKNLKNDTKQMDVVSSEHEDEIFLKNIDEYDFFAQTNKLILKAKDKDDFIFELDVLNATNIKEIYFYDNKLVLLKGFENFCEIFVYDLQDLNNIFISNQIKIDGNFFDVRFVKDYVYVVTKTESIYKMGVRNIVLPKIYTDNTNYFNTDLKQIKYFSDINDDKFTLVTCFNISDKLKKPIVTTYFGAGKNIFLNDDFLYVITSKNNFNSIYAFSLLYEKVEYIKRIDFKGKILSIEYNDVYNEFEIVVLSMDSNYNEVKKTYFFNENLDVFDK